MLHFSALVCPGLADSSGKGPSLALLVMLIINDDSKETGVTAARGPVIALLAAAGISCRDDPSLCHRSPADLVPIWDVQKCMGSRAVWAMGAWVPVLCLRRQVLTGASYLALVARWIREIRSQQRWVAALPSAEEFERV